jgi:PhnB protein
MASILNPYVNVPDGRAREAVEFYRSVLGGDARIITFGEMGAQDETATQVMHAQLETPAGFTLMVADAPPQMVQVTYGDNVSISLSGGPEDGDDLRGWFAGLAEGGDVRQPLIPAPWGDEFGMLTDKFGIGWMVNIAGAGSPG